MALTECPVAGDRRGVDRPVVCGVDDVGVVDLPRVGQQLLDRDGAGCLAVGLHMGRAPADAFAQLPVGEREHPLLGLRQVVVAEVVRGEGDSDGVVDERSFAS